MNEEVLTPIHETAIANHYPCLIPAFQIRNNALYFGNHLIKDLNLKELLFLSCCDGEIDYESIQSNIPESADFRRYLAPFLIELPLKKETKPIAEHSPTILVISPHGFEGYLSIGETIENWNSNEIIVHYLTCFTQQSTVRKDLDIENSEALNMLRKDETELCARLCVTINHQLNFPDHQFAQTHLFPDDFAKQYKKVSGVLRQQLYKTIHAINPDKIYFPAGLLDNKDGALIFELILDFYKKSLFPSTLFYSYADFPFSANYSAIDDLRITLTDRFVHWEEVIEKTEKSKNINAECYRIFSSLFEPSSKKIISNLIRRNTILAGEAEGSELNHFFKLTDKAINQ
jgi:hypothetical protein